MYLLNTSIHVEHAFYNAATKYVKEHVIPALTEDGIFRDPLMLELLIDVDPAMKSFSLQLRAADLAKATEKLDKAGAPLFAELIKMCGGSERAVLFTTPMKIID